jgi:hypothetical protein
MVNLYVKPKKIAFPGSITTTIADEVGVEIIDIDSVFRAHTDPLSLFPFRLIGHYTPEGYGMIADILLEYISENS